MDLGEFLERREEDIRDIDIAFALESWVFLVVFGSCFSFFAVCLRLLG